MSLTDIRLADVADVLPGGVLLVDLDGRLIDSNRRGRALLRVDDANSAIDLASRLVESADDLRAYLTRCAGSREPLPGRITPRLPDAESRHLSVIGARVGNGDRAWVLLRCEDPEGDSPHHRFVTLNATIDRLRSEVQARRRAESLLVAEKRVLADIVAGVSLTDGLAALSEAIEANSAGMLVSILLLDEGHLHHAAAPSVPARYIAAINGVAIGPNVGSCGTAAYTGETVIVANVAEDPRWTNYRELALRDGLVACWSTPIRSSDGAILGTLALYYRSERSPTLAELTLIENSAHIAGLAIERHRSREALQTLLESERFERERAENEIRVKDQFLAILSHELRNPLGAISNAAYALDASAKTDESRARMLTVIVDETKMLKRILDDLLDISRLNSGKMSLRMTPVDVAACLEELLAVCHATYPDRSITLNCDDNLSWVDGDRARLQQLILNLIDNAVKYSPDESTVRVAATNDEKFVAIAVRDEGEGIDPRLLPRIFEPFIQSDESLERSGSGLGLGLALVQRFAQMHGGTVSAHSDGLGQGSEFTLRLPARAAAERAESVQGAQPAKSTTARRVMIVEDNAGAREGLCQLLKFWGHEVSSAEDGESALDLMRADPPDLALVDIGLPRMDGYALARAIRRDRSGGAIKLIALTGYGQEQDRQRALDAGFESHLVKPVDANDLRKIVEGACTDA